MAYDKKVVFEQAKKAVTDNTLYFIEDIIAYIPISKFTFYNFFPVDSNEYNELKGIIEQNKIATKNKLLKRWQESENPTLELATMRIVGGEGIRRKLSTNYVQHSGDEENPVKVSNEHHVYFHKYDEPKGDE